MTQPTVSESTEGSSSPKDRLQSHQVHLTVLQAYTCTQYIHKMNLRTVKWAQWDKTQSRELLGLFICVCTALCTIVAHNIAQNDNVCVCVCVCVCVFLSLLLFCGLLSEINFMMMMKGIYEIHCVFSRRNRPIKILLYSLALYQKKLNVQWGKIAYR